MAQIALAWEPGAGQSGQILPTIIVTNECKCLPLLWHFPFNHSKKGSWSFCKQQHWLDREAPWGFETCGLDCIKHSLLRLSHVFAYLLCVWGGEGASGIDPLRSGSILDHFIGVEYWRLLKTTNYPTYSMGWCCAATPEVMPADNPAPSYHNLSVNLSLERAWWGLTCLPTTSFKVIIAASFDGSKLRIWDD